MYAYSQFIQLLSILCSEIIVDHARQDKLALRQAQLMLGMTTEPSDGKVNDDLGYIQTYPSLSEKGIRSYTQHVVSKFISYDKLSPKFLAFTTTSTKIDIPRDIKEVFTYPKWRMVVQEKMEALEKNGTQKILKLLNGKKTVGCK